MLLPDTKSSVRWVQFDAPDFAKALKAAGVTYFDQQRAQRPAEAEGAGPGVPGRRRQGGHRDRARQRLCRGDREAVHDAGGYAIDYDRQVLGGSAVGLRHLRRQGRRRGAGQRRHRRDEGERHLQGRTVAELWGGPTDQNAFWFKSGNDAVFNPLFANGTLKKGPQQFVPDWDATNAATIFAQMLVKTNNNIQGVLAANDNIAGAVIADLKAKGLKPVPISGQDATAQGIQYILAGWQTARSTSTCRSRRTPPQLLRSRFSTARSRRRTGTG